MDLDPAAYGTTVGGRGAAPGEVTLEQVTEALQEAQFALRDQACGIKLMARAVGTAADEHRVSALQAHAEVLHQLAERLGADPAWSPAAPAA